jgi:DNA-binding winged helix-turn-helix (wHTH) protein
MHFRVPSSDLQSTGAPLPNPDPRIVRFGVFEFDVETGDVWNAGHRMRLQEQPRRVLLMLLARPGDLVSREELRAALWSEDTFVDFDAGVNVVVNKIRQVLHDSASSPRFIETVPRRGYRFIAPVASGRARDDVRGLPAERSDIADTKPEDRSLGPSPLRTPSRLRGARWIPVLVGSVAIAVAGISAVGYLSRTGSSRRLRPLPVTSLPGMEYSPAVSPDGSHVAFLWAAADQWSPDFQLYVQPIGADRPLKLTNGEGDAFQPTWSPDGKYIAVLRHPERTNMLLHDIVIVPATGGAERRLGTVTALQHGLSWSPDGRFLAVVDRPSETEPEAIFLLSTETGRKERLTTPPANYDGDCFPRFSPDGHALAFVRARTYLHASMSSEPEADSPNASRTHQKTNAHRASPGTDDRSTSHYGRAGQGSRYGRCHARAGRQSR